LAAESKPGWYEQYEKLNSAKFTYENSGNRAGLSAPGRRSIGGPGIEISVPCWRLIGYTLDPPFQPCYPAVAIMFESPDYEFMWWHFLKDNEA
jgi:hypothetical protein